MAVLTLDVVSVLPGSATIAWKITDVGSIITTVGLANEPASGSSVPPSIIYDSGSVENLSGYGFLTITPSMCEGGVFKCYGYGSDGKWYYSAGGEQSVVVFSRPSDWSWKSSIASGSDILLTASEWNLFCERINEFRSYRDLNNYSFESAVRGTTKISASIVNAARSAIAEMSPVVSLPAAVSAGDDISAAFFNGLRSSLNSIT